MVVPSRADRILAEGKFGTVEFAVRLNGTMEAREWFELQTQDVQIRFGVLFEMIATRDPNVPNKDQFKHLEGALFEFRRKQIRIFCFLHGRRYLLTHVTVKKTQKTPRREIDLAFKIGNEHVEWEKNESK